MLANALYLTDPGKQDSVECFRTLFMHQEMSTASDEFFEPPLSSCAPDLAFELPGAACSDSADSDSSDDSFSPSFSPSLSASPSSGSFEDDSASESECLPDISPASPSLPAHTHDTRSRGHAAKRSRGAVSEESSPDDSQSVTECDVVLSLDDPLSIALPRETLLKISSRQFEAFIEGVRGARVQQGGAFEMKRGKAKVFTKAEDQEIMKMKRLIKNRESAMLSRNRRKEYIETLEEEKRGLLAVNAHLQARNSALEGECAALRARLAAAGLDEPAEPNSTLFAGLGANANKRRRPDMAHTMLFVFCFFAFMCSSLMLPGLVGWGAEDAVVGPQGGGRVLFADNSADVASWMPMQNEGSSLMSFNATM